MYANEIEVGGVYMLEWGGDLPEIPVTVLSTRIGDRHEGEGQGIIWRCRNELTTREIEVKDPLRFRERLPSRHASFRRRCQ